MQLIRKQPVVMKAVQWKGDNPDEVLRFLGEDNFTVTIKKSRLLVQSMSSRYAKVVRLHRWIVKDYMKLSVLSSQDIVDQFDFVDELSKSILTKEIENSAEIRNKFFESAHSILDDEDN